MSKENVVEGEYKVLADKKDDETKQYKNKVVFLRKSKKGEHLYAFDNKGVFATAAEGSIIMNISEVQDLIAGKFSSIKVSILPKEEEDDLGKD